MRNSTRGVSARLATGAALLALFERDRRRFVAAHAALRQKFKFSDRQTTAILEMRLQKLAGLERKKIEDHIFEAAPGQFSRITQYIEALPNGVEHLIVEKSDDNKGSDNTSIYTVPADHYFMMGDNRDNSNDSRFTSVGFVPRENFVGRAEFIFFSIDGSAWKIWTWLDKLRPSRFFTSIE